MKISKYKVVELMKAEDLNHVVNLLIEQGWQPLGPAFKVGQVSIAQTLVKYEEKTSRYSKGAYTGPR